MEILNGPFCFPNSDDTLSSTLGNSFRIFRETCRKEGDLGLGDHSIGAYNPHDERRYGKESNPPPQNWRWKNQESFFPHSLRRPGSHPEY
jgi:hypothetical protein